MVKTLGNLGNRKRVRLWVPEPIHPSGGAEVAYPFLKVHFLVCLLTFSGFANRKEISI